MTRPYPATQRQQDALRFIAGYQEAHDGVCPSHEEVCAALGLRSKSSVTRILACLEERGCIRHLHNRARALDVLSPVSIPRAPDGAPLYFIAVPQPEGRAA